MHSDSERSGLSPSEAVAPLENQIDARRLQEIYDRTAPFYDGLVAGHQAAAKETAIALLQRRRGERFLEVGCGTGWAFSRIV